MTYVYPTNIADAAATLDLAMPGWASRLNLDRLRMGCGSSCVLGQLGGFYQNMDKLFGYSREHCRIHKTPSDFIFGVPASNDAWKEEIRRRLPKKVQTMDFSEALKHLKCGKRIRRKNEEGKTYEIYLADGSIKELTWAGEVVKIQLGPKNLLATDWEVVKTTVADLAFNDKFVYDGRTYTIVEDIYNQDGVDATCLSGTKLSYLDKNLEVEKV